MNDSLRKTNVCFARFADRTVSPNFQTQFPSKLPPKALFLRLFFLSEDLNKYFFFLLWNSWKLKYFWNLNP